MLYPIAIEVSDDLHAFGVTVPDLPGCFSAGDTRDEAIANAKEAISGHIKLLVELESDIPFASSVDTLAKVPEFAGYTWAVVDIDVTWLKSSSKQITKQP